MEAIQWSELTNKEKVKLILQHVSGCFIYEDEQRHEEIRGVDAHNAGFHYPHAYWDQSVEHWRVAGETSMLRPFEPEIFDPLHDLNDAWHVTEAEKFTKVELERFQTGPLVPPNQQYLCRIIASGRQSYAYAYGGAVQEAICIAVLRTCGLKVEP